MKELIAITSSGSDRGGHSVSLQNGVTVETSEHGGTFVFPLGGIINLGKPSEDIVLDEFTFSVWLNMETGTHPYGLMLSPDDWHSNGFMCGSEYYYVQLTNGEYHNISNGTPKSVGDGKFHHYAITRDKNRCIRVFIDGRMVDKWWSNNINDGFKIFDKNKDIIIGRNKSSVVYAFKGKMADFILVDKCMWNNSFIPPQKSIVDYGWKNTNLLTISKNNKVWRWEELGLVKVADDWNTLSDTEKVNLFKGASSVIPSDGELEMLGDYKVAIYSEVNKPIDHLSILGVPSCQILHANTPIDLDGVEYINTITPLLHPYAYSQIQGNKALLHFENSAVRDDYENQWAGGNGVGIVDTEKKFGNSCLSVNKLDTLKTSTSYIQFEFDDFTIDFWYKVKEGNPYMGLFSSNDNRLRLDSMSGGSFYVAGVLVKNPIPELKFDDDWHHIAVTRKDKVYYLFIDGKLIHTEDRYKMDQPNFYCLGGINASTYYCKGYFDELRVLRGYCAWTEDFTPPTEPYKLDHIIPRMGVYFAFKTDDDLPKIVNGTDWREIKEEDVPFEGMRSDQVAEVTKAMWDKLIAGKKSLDIVISLNRRYRSETSYLNRIYMNYVTSGSWKKAVHSSEYVSEYIANKTLQVTIYPMLPYKINYKDL